MKILLCLAAAFILFAAVPQSSEARHGSARGERRIGGIAKKLLHPLQSLKARRAR